LFTDLRSRQLDKTVDNPIVGKSQGFLYVCRFPVQYPSGHFQKDEIASLSVFGDRRFSVQTTAITVDTKQSI